MTTLSAHTLLPSTTSIANSIPTAPYVFEILNSPEADIMAQVPLTVVVPWDDELPKGTGLVCRAAIDIVSDICCTRRGGKVLPFAWYVGPGGQQSAASSAPASSAPASSGSASGSAWVMEEWTTVMLCAWPDKDASEFEACAREKKYNTTTMCYDPN